MQDHPRRWRDRVSAGHVIATLALFLALGGISYAAVSIPKNSVGKKQLKKNSVVSSKVKNGALAAKDFKDGQLPAGPQGQQGAIGPKGLPGTPGAAGATTSVLTGRTSLGVGDSFFAPSGIATAGATESPAQILSPGVASKAANLSVRLDASPGPGSSRVVTLRVNGVDSALTCTIPSAGTTCTNTGAQVSVPAGSLLSLENDSIGGAPVPSGAQFGLTVQP